MTKLQSLLLCVFLFPVAVYATTCPSDATLTGNEALDSQDPACHMSRHSAYLNNTMLGIHGPLSVSTEYSEHYGFNVKAHYTHLLQPDSAIAVALNWGAKENRVGFTFGHDINLDHRFKLTAERLSQKIDYDFSSGEVTKWTSQYAFGADYQYVIPHAILSSVDLAAYYAEAQSKSLASKLYVSGGSTYRNDRHIAGATSQGFSLGVAVQPWETGLFDVTAHYDTVRYDRYYETDANDDKGLGAGIALKQLLSDRLKLTVLASSRVLYDEYHAGLSWLLDTAHDTRLELGINASRSVGHGTVSDNRFGLSANYLWNIRQEKKGYALPSASRYGALRAFVQNPAVHMAQVLSTVDQRSVLSFSLTELPLPLMLAALADPNNNVTITLFVDELADVNVLNYVPTRQASNLSVDPTHVAGLSYDSSTGHFTGTPHSADIGSHPITVAASVPSRVVTQGLGQTLQTYETVLNFDVKSHHAVNIPWQNTRFVLPESAVVHHGVIQVDPGDTVSVTLKKGPYWYNGSVPASSADLFLYPATGAQDKKITRITGLNTVTCDRCNDARADNITLHIAPGPDSAKTSPYLLALYPQNINGEGKPQMLKVQVGSVSVPTITWNNSVQARAVDTTHIQAEWAEDAVDSMPDAHISYTAELVEGSDEPVQIPGQATFSRLRTDTTYTVRVTASDDQGAVPVYYDMSVNTAKGIVWEDSVSVDTINTTSIRVTWSHDASDDVAGANVSYTATINPVQGHVQETSGGVDFTGLSTNTDFTITVTASDDKGSLPVSYSKPGTTAARITWPGTVSASATSRSSLEATWVENATSTVVGGTLTYTATLMPDQVPDTQAAGHATFTGLTPQTDYHVAVTVADGVSQPVTHQSPVVHTFQGLVWDQPSLRVVPNNDNQIKATWDQATDDIPGANVTYAATIAEVTDTKGHHAHMMTADSAGEKVFSNLKASTAYKVTVIASDDKGSPSVRVTSDAVSTYLGIEPVDNIDISALTTKTMHVSWQAANDSVPGANLHYALGVDNPDVIVTPMGELAANVSGLAPDTSYTLTLTISDDKGSTPQRPEQSLTTPHGIAWSGGVKTIEHSVGEHSADITWNLAMDDVEGATVTFTLASTPASHIEQDAENRMATLTGLSPGTSYKVFVTAVDNKGSASVENHATFTTQRPEETLGCPVGANIPFPRMHDSTTDVNGKTFVDAWPGENIPMSGTYPRKSEGEYDFLYLLSATLDDSKHLVCHYGFNDDPLMEPGTEEYTMGLRHALPSNVILKSRNAGKVIDDEKTICYAGPPVRKEDRGSDDCYASW